MSPGRTCRWTAACTPRCDHSHHEQPRQGLEAHVAQESSELQAALERVEAQLAIGQLPARYALALDSRNLEDLGNLFAADVDCGRWGTGREALKAYYASKHALSGFYRCVHLI